MIVYVVQDYDRVAYAGVSFAEARTHLRGSNKVQVWQNGERLWAHDLRHTDNVAAMMIEREDRDSDKPLKP